MHVGDLDFAWRNINSVKDPEYLFDQDTNDEGVIHQDEHSDLGLILIVV